MLVVEKMSLAECLAKLPEPECKDEFPFETGLSVEHDEAIFIAENSMRLVNGHYVVGPLVGQTSTLADKYSMTARRLELLQKRITHNPFSKFRYAETFKDHVSEVVSFSISTHV